jgi:hypothetical protein
MTEIDTGTEKTLGQIAQDAYWEGIAVVPDPEYDRRFDRVASAVRLAVIEECARAADAYSWTLPFYGSSEMNAATDDAAEAARDGIAEAIRALKAAPASSGGGIE